MNIHIDVYDDYNKTFICRSRRACVRRRLKGGVVVYWHQICCLHRWTAPPLVVWGGGMT